MERKHIFLFGYPLSHSISPLLHNEIYRSLSLPWTYWISENQDLAQALPLIDREDWAGGAGVTMPFKVQIRQHLGGLTEAADAVGSCNTIFIGKNGKLWGENTDIIGITEAIRG